MLIPPHLATPAFYEVLAGARRGEAVLIPEPAMTGCNAEMLARILIHLGIEVIIVPGIHEVTTRERGEA